MQESKYIQNIDYSELEKKFEVRDFPLNVAVEPSNFCNLKCKMCGNKDLKRSRGHMDMALYRKIIDEIAETNPMTRLWLDFYGEPLLERYKLYFMIDYAKKKGLANVNMNTNGTLLSTEMIDMLLDSGIDFISIDMDAFSKEVFETIRSGADRDVVYENVRRFIQRKEMRGCKKPVLEIKVIEMPENQAEIQDIIDYWKQYKIRINVRKLATWGGNVNVSASGNCLQEERSACGYAIGQFAIAWDGRVAVCGWDAELKGQIGNINEESIQQIWKRKKDTIIKAHMEHRFDELPDICRNCTDWRCAGGELRLDETGMLYDRNYNSNADMLK